MTTKQPKSLRIAWSDRKSDLIPVGPGKVFISFSYESYGLVLETVRQRHVFPWHKINEVLEIKK